MGIPWHGGCPDLPLHDTVPTALTETQRSGEPVPIDPTDRQVPFDRIAETYGIVEVLYDERGVFVDCVIRDANPAFERAVGLPRAQFIDRRATEVMGSSPEVVSYLRAYAAVDGSGEPAHFDAQYAARGLHFHVSAFPLGNHRVGVLSVDTTDRVRAEERMKELNETLEERVRERTEQLAESRGKLQSLIETTSTGYVILDARGYVTDANQEYVRLTGHRTLGEILGRNVVEWTAEYDHERNAAEVRRCVECGFVRDLEIDYIDGEGRITPIEINATALSSGASARILTLCRDITERRQAEEALRSSEMLLELAVAATNGGVWDLEFDPEIPGVLPDRIYISPQLKALVGYAEDELPNSIAAWQDLIVPEDRVRVQASAQDHLAGLTERHEVEYRIRHRDGNLRWIHTQGKVQRDGQGRAVRCTGIDWDVTEHRRAEEALQASERQYRATVDSLADALHVVDRDLRIVLINGAFNAWCDRMRLPRGRPGLPLFELFPFLPESVRDEYREVFRTGRTLHTEDITRTSEGEVITETRKVPVVENGTVQRVITVVRDITARKRAEEALQRARDELERRVDERTAQLRALTAQLVRAEEHERARIAEILHDDVQQMLVAVQYTISGVQGSPKAERERTVRKANEILREAVERTRSLSITLRPPVLYEFGVGAALSWLSGEVREQQGLSVQMQVDEAAEPASNELRTFIFQSVRELLLNVVKHSGVRAAEVRLGLVGDDRIRVQVQDSGVGFDESHGKAACMGLLGIRERAGFLGGTMEISSESGKGTCVTLILPKR